MKMECVISASLLLAAIAPRPGAESLPESALELLTSDVESSLACAPNLEDLVRRAAHPLLLIVQCCENRSAVAGACLALARLTAVNTSAQMVLDKGAMTLLAKLVPNRPTVKHNMASVEKDDLMRGDAVTMARLPPSFFRLIAGLAKVPDGASSVQASGILKRCVERMTMGDSGDHDLAVKTEIALLLARMANKYSPEFGATTDLMLTTKFNLVPTLTRMLATRSHPRRTRYAGCAALKALCEDVSRGARVVLTAAVRGSGDGDGAGGPSTPPSRSAVATELVRVVSERGVAHPLLRQALHALKLMASSPESRLKSSLVECGVLEPLRRIAADSELEACYFNRAGIDLESGLSEVARETLVLITDHTKSGGQLTLAPLQEGGAGGALGRSGASSPSPPRSSLAEGLQEGDIAIAASKPQLSLGNGPSQERGFTGKYTAVGVTRDGSLAGDPDAAHEAGRDAELTPLALLSARDERFRSELKRRKRYYELDRSVDENAAGEDGEGGEGGGEVEAEAETPTKPTNVPVVALAGSGGSHLCGTVASLEQNPHLKRTRPPGKPKATPDKHAAPTDKSGATRSPLRSQALQTKAVPLARQLRGQMVEAKSEPPPSNTLMLDPVFGDSHANTSGLDSVIAKIVTGMASTGLTVEQDVSAHVLGAEQFSHTRAILGHSVELTYERKVPGRVAESSAHAKTTSFKNVELSVESMVREREQQTEARTTRKAGQRHRATAGR